MSLHIEKEKIKKYIKQKLTSDDKKTQYVCIMRFRKKHNLSKIKGIYGSSTITKEEHKSNKIIKGNCKMAAIKAMLKHARDSFGFNWKDFEVMNIKTGRLETA